VVEPVRVTNTSTSAISAWTVTFSLPAGHTLTGSWNTVAAVSGQTVAARNASYNGNLQPNGATAFGFQVRRPAGNTQVPTAFACTSP
jgi:endo-1,4-beta-xylanase